MRTRIIALIVALVLAIAGGVILVDYVRGADQRAAEGVELTGVLVVAQQVPAGTSVEELLLRVEPRSIPVAFLAEGAVADLEELGALRGLVTTAALVPGEQLIRERLASPQAFVSGGGAVQIPEGFQEVSVSLDAPRLLGGRLAAGDLVGVFVSLDGGGDNPRQTRLLLEKVLVTAVTGGSEGAGGSVVVTLAVTQQQAQAVIYAREFASLWFSKQNEETAPRNQSPYTLEELLG